jgi:hypothetical protein
MFPGIVWFGRWSASDTRSFDKKGSHVRLEHEGPPPHAITVPLHNPLKIGTLHGILAEVGLMRSVAIDSLIESL